MRCFAPPMLAEAWRQAVAPTGDARDQLGTRMALVEAILRYLVAALAAEVAGLGALESVGGHRSLLEKLPDNPSWGDWSRCAWDLAKCAAKQRAACVAPELAEVLYTLHRNGPRPTPAAQALKRFVERRNSIVHPDNGALTPNEAEARSILTETNADLRVILEALRVLRRYPLYCCVAVRRRQGRGRVATLLHLTGTDFERSQVPVGPSFDLPEGIPFLVSATTGDVLLLAPYVVAGPSSDRHEWTVRLLAGASSKPPRLLYADGLQRDAAPFDWPESDEPDWLPPTNLVGRAPDHARMDGVFDERERLRLAQPEEAPGRVGPYTVEALLGRGASGRVYRATDTEGRVVALKLLHRSVLADPQFRKRLKGEYEAMARLTHPKIARVYAFEEDPELGPYLVLECVEGTDLSARVARAPLSADAAGQVGLAVLAALSAAHAKGVFHRDIKPGNIMVDAAGEVRLLDFGVATAEWLARATLTVDAVGTTAFAAPEQLRGDEVDERADLYAVGRTLEFLLEGRVGDKAQMDLVEGLRAVVRKATQPDPAHRWSTARQMAEALQERMDADWAGAPVHVGDVLNQSYELHDLLNTPADGLWLFDAREITTQLPCCVLVGRVDRAPSIGEMARDRLLQGGRAPSGYRGVQRTPDALEFLSLRAEDWEGGGGLATELLGIPPDPLLAPADPMAAPRVFDVALPPELAGLGRAPGSYAVADLLDAVHRVMDLADLLYATARGRGIRAPHPHQRSIRPLSRRGVDRVAGVDRPVGIDRAGAYADLRSRRNASRHHAGSPGAPRESDWMLLEEYVADVSLLTGSIALPQLSPAVTEHPALGWAVLDFDRAEYRGLDLTSLQAAPVPEHLTEAVASLLRQDLHKRGSGGAGLSRRAEAARTLETASQLQKWRLAEDVRQDVPVAGKGRMQTADIVVSGPGGRPMAVVEVKASLGGAARGLEQQLWRYAKALGTPFAALSDGATSRWYRVDPDRGMTELDGRPDEAPGGQRDLFDHPTDAEE